MCKEEESVRLGKLVEAGEVERVDREIVFIGIEDGGCQGQRLLETTLCEEEFRFREEKIGIGGEIVMRAESL